MIRTLTEMDVVEFHIFNRGYTYFPSADIIRKFIMRRGYCV